MRFDKATTLLAAIQDGRIRSAADHKRLNIGRSTFFRWVDSLRGLGVVIDSHVSPWRVKSYGPFKRTRK